MFKSHRHMTSDERHARHLRFKYRMTLNRLVGLIDRADRAGDRRRSARLVRLYERRARSLARMGG